jgi:hypothetical protein
MGWEDLMNELAADKKIDSLQGVALHVWIFETIPPVFPT